jgi:hypothetical protein
MNSYGVPPTLPPNNAHQEYKPYSQSVSQLFMLQSGLGAPGRLGPKGAERKKATDSFV